MYIYIVIRGPRVHHSLTGSSIYILPSAATYYHNRIYTYVVYGAVSICCVQPIFDCTIYMAIHHLGIYMPDPNDGSATCTISAHPQPVDKE